MKLFRGLPSQARHAARIFGLGAFLLSGALSPSSHAQSTPDPLRTLYTFGSVDNSGGYDNVNSSPAPIIGADGNFYGINSSGGDGQGRVYRMSPAGAVTPIHDFQFTDGSSPWGSLVQGSDGALYGTTTRGGANDGGVIFKLNPDGTQFRVLHSFGGQISTDGNDSNAGLLIASDGYLYGTTLYGGDVTCKDPNTRISGCGTVFRIAPDGSGYSVLHTFSYANGDGAFPRTRLLQAVDGYIYGTSGGGGVYGNGTIFSFAPGGSGYLILYSFGSIQSDGISPSTDLMQGADGNLYGTAFLGGYQNYGIVYKVDFTAGIYEVLHYFLGPQQYDDGVAPSGGLQQGPDGRLYGPTQNGGPLPDQTAGVLFSLNTDGSDYQIVYAFGQTGTIGVEPFGSIIRDANGNLYGQAGGLTSDSGLIYKISPDRTVSAVGRFGTQFDGVRPSYKLFQGSDGLFYGTTSGGGGSTSNPSCGSLFSIAADGTGYKQLYAFSTIIQRAVCVNPTELIQGLDGNLYGTSAGESIFNDYGSIFRIARDGSGFTVLHSFDGSDGINPYAGLLLASDGMFYGTTYASKSNDFGVVFGIAANGSGYHVLHTFTGTGDDGEHPWAGLVESADGRLYGTTQGGGTGPTNCLQLGCGTIFSIAKDGSGYVTLHSFAPNGVDDGMAPQTGLTKGSDGRFYGIAGGKIFGIDSNGSHYTKLYDLPDFTNTHSSGFSGIVFPAMIAARDGYLYGVNPLVGTGVCPYGGDAAQCGTIFKIAPDGSRYTEIYKFNGADEGGTPVGGIIQARDGRFYGTTYQAGGIPYANSGTVFSLPGPPAVPANLKITANQAQVSLSWDASAGATSYNIYMGTATAQEPAAPVKSGLTGTEATITALNPDTRYFFYVTAFNSAGETLASSEVSAMPRALPQAPTNLVASAVAPGQINLSWDATPGATSYNIYQGISAGGESVGSVQTVTGHTTTAISGLNNGTTYFFYVKAFNASGGSASSNEASATPLAFVPTLSVSLTPTIISLGGSATLTWTSANVDSCTASGAWSGSKTLSGQQTVTPNAAGAQTFTLNCAGGGGSIARSATLTVNSPDGSSSGGAGSNSSSDSGGGGGGTANPLLLLLMSLAALARYTSPSRQPSIRK